MLLRTSLPSVFTAVALVTACTDPAPLDRDDAWWADGYIHDEIHVGAEDDPSVMFAPSQTVGSAARTGACTTAVVRGIAEQLVNEVECMRPGTMARIDELPGVGLAPATFPYLQRPAADALGRAAATRSMTINSALRTVVQQYVLYTWYVRGRCTHVVSLAAPPGRSNHEAGLAIDVANHDAAYPALTSRGFAWLGDSDPVHYDYVSGGVDLRSLSVRAFQRLWNRANPTATIAEDGVWGGSTEAAVAASPTAGFATGTTCTTGVGGRAPIEVYWSRDASGRYALRALTADAVVRVTYAVDGFVIGQATRAAGANFPDDYVFDLEREQRRLVVTGYDAEGAEIARGVGLLDVTPNTGVYIKQMGSRLYEIGLERAPAGVAAIEVRVDGWLLTDGETGATRSTRGAVRSMFNQLGSRDIEITTLGADGAVRGTLRRTFTLE